MSWYILEKSSNLTWFNPTIKTTTLKNLRRIPICIKWMMEQLCNRFSSTSRKWMFTWLILVVTPTFHLKARTTTLLFDRAVHLLCNWRQKRIAPLFGCISRVGLGSLLFPAQQDAWPWSRMLPRQQRDSGCIKSKSIVDQSARWQSKWTRDPNLLLKVQEAPLKSFYSYVV